MKLLRRSLVTAAAATAAFPTIIPARAQERQLYIGMYNNVSCKLIETDVIPTFERDYKCRVYVLEGATLSNIAALRATRDTPKYSVMMMDDVGIPQTKDEDLIVRLDPEKIPNLAHVYKRFLFEDGYGVAWMVSWASMFENPQLTKLASYQDIFDAKYRRKILLNTPRNTQSVLMLIAATALATGKPLKDAQYMIDQGWDKLATLKPNVLTIYDNEGMLLMVAQGQAEIGGIEYSKAIWPHTHAGIPLVMADLREGAFSGINCMTMVKNAPEPELGAAFINRLLSPEVTQMIAERSLGAPPISGLNFAPDIAKLLAYPESKLDDMGLITPDWRFIIPKRDSILERYNQVFTG